MATVNESLMRKLLREVDWEPTRNEGECRAVLRLDTTPGDERIVGSLIQQHRRRMHRVGYSSQEALVIFFDPLRGDEPPSSTEARLYLHDTNNVSSPATLVVNGLSLADLERDADRFVLCGGTPFFNTTLLKALTVDGFGGQVNWTDGSTFSAAILYYLENIYARVPAAQLEKVGTTSRNGVFYEQADVLNPQVQDLNSWYDRYYMPQVLRCPTHRPFTETYFAQLREEGLPAGEEADIGEKFFTDYTYRRMKAMEDEILRYRRTA